MLVIIVGEYNNIFFTQWTILLKYWWSHLDRQVLNELLAIFFSSEQCLMMKNSWNLWDSGFGNRETMWWATLKLIYFNHLRKRNTYLYIRLFLYNTFKKSDRKNWYRQFCVKFIHWVHLHLIEVFNFIQTRKCKNRNKGKSYRIRHNQIWLCSVTHWCA